MIYSDVYTDDYGDYMAITLGIDVSSHQGAISWSSVARTSYRFGLCRMTVGRSTRDDRGRANLKAMLDTMPVAGAYGVVGTSEPVEAGAKFLIDEIALAGVDPGRILVMLDAENFGDGTHPTIDQVNRYAQTLHGLLGRWPVAYVPGWWMRQHGYTAAGLGLSNCPWAPSHYIASPWTETRLLANKPALEFGFKQLGWLQYTSSATSAGVSGSVDANCFYGTLTQLRAQLLGEQEDLSIVDAETKIYLDAQFATLATKVQNGVAILMRGDETTDSTKDTHPDNIGRVRQDLAAGLSAVNTQLATIAGKVGQTVDPAAVAALVAGQLEITGVATDPGGVVTVQFGPKPA
jgi:GH25 family lysozyme M1 (1,4-beta-N-acetylmuramidase)